MILNSLENSAQQELTGICGVIGKSERSVAFAVDAMLKAMQRRGTSTESYLDRVRGRTIGIGICDGPAFCSRRFRYRGDLAIAIDGFFYEEKLIEERLHVAGPRGLAGLLSLPGAFGFLSATDDGLIAGREPVGQKPLYFAEGSQDIGGFASTKAGLLAIGAGNPQPVPPGTLFVLSEIGFRVADGSHQLKEPAETAVREADALPKLHELLVQAVSNGIPEKTGIAFSGGLDSAIVATIARDCRKDPELVTIGLEGQPELDHAHNVAAELGLPITILEVTPSEVLDSLTDVVSVVESTNPVIVGVSIPFYFVCRKVREMGRTIVMAGQMSDELFGGYARFEELTTKGKPDQARIEMWKSILAASTNDFEPADKVAVSLGLELRCPFAYLPLVEYALGLPLSLKVSVSAETVTRKHIMRKLATRLKLPDSVVQRPKKAVQYSSGVQKVLLKEARRRNLSLDRFLASFVN